MQVYEYIDTNVPYLKDSDSVRFALDLMAANAITELPVVMNKKYIGMVTEDMLLNFEDLSASICPGPLENSKISIKENEHIFELIRKMIDTNVFNIAIVAADDSYVGTASAKSIVRKLGSNSSLMEPGGMIVLEMNKTDYSLSEIARIVESNDALILNCFISSHENINQIEVSLKINKTDLQDIIHSFERYEYTVKASYHQATAADDMQERYESLMHYLNM
jgi:CBS domain-containing protein